MLVVFVFSAVRIHNSIRFLLHEFLEINMPHATLTTGGGIFPQAHSDRDGKCLVVDFTYILSTHGAEPFSFSMSCNHVFVDWINISASDCKKYCCDSNCILFENGFLVFICSICGKSRVEIYKSPVQFSNKFHLQFGHVWEAWLDWSWISLQPAFSDK